ncbi:MAG: hypothetical protein NW214_12475 [Pseudanabaenaceae cyanobacterium bins.39]|nr:hypothetical protein [Pseudanabaenaceae cyanobacterium bins.39]
MRKSLVWITLLAIAIDPWASAIAQNVFGQAGQNGLQGRDGRDGRDAQSIRVIGDGKPMTYDLSGTDGEDGEDGNAGRSASSCEQPLRPEYSLIGASGGNGGNGGNGGRGGNGGNATILFTDLANLRQIEIRNAGGRGGRNGRGANAGIGCSCQEAQWQINYCTWQIDRRPWVDPKTNPQPPNWQYYSRETQICDTSRWGKQSIPRNIYGSDYDNEYAREYRRGDWLYRRTYKGITSTNSYSCRNGNNGRTGADGNLGAQGSYGRITLVPRLDIPAEILSDRALLSSAIGKQVPLIKNIWVERSGLSRLLHPSSNVSDRYTYLKDTAKLFYRFEWAASESPVALGIDRLEIGADAIVRNETAEIDYQIPNTVEYQILPMTGQNQVVKITGGFHPDRLSSFQLQTVSGSGTDGQITLSDRGNIRELLKETNINVQCLTKESATGVVSDNYVSRRNIIFKIPPKLPANNGAIVAGTNYSLPIGRFCSPWLRPNYQAAYQIAISQVTKSGAVYTQNLETQFVVNP